MPTSASPSTTVHEPDRAGLEEAGGPGLEHLQRRRAAPRSSRPPRCSACGSGRATETFSMNGVSSGTKPLVSGSPVMWMWVLTRPGVMTNRDASTTVVGVPAGCHLRGLADGHDLVAADRHGTVGDDPAPVVHGDHEAVCQQGVGASGRGRCGSWMRWSWAACLQVVHVARAVHGARAVRADQVHVLARQRRQRRGDVGADRRLPTGAGLPTRTPAPAVEASIVSDSSSS